MLLDHRKKITVEVLLNEKSSESVINSVIVEV